MAKTPTQYLAAQRTDNQQLFLDWVLAETGVKFKTAAERDAFALGVKAAGLYSRYQASKRQAAPAPTKVTAPATRKARAK